MPAGVMVCPVCRSNTSANKCIKCGYSISGDFVLLPTIGVVSQQENDLHEAYKRQVIEQYKNTLRKQNEEAKRIAEENARKEAAAKQAAEVKAAGGQDKKRFWEMTEAERTEYNDKSLNKYLNVNTPVPVNKVYKSYEELHRNSMSYIIKDGINIGAVKVPAFASLDTDMELPISNGGDTNVRVVAKEPNSALHIILASCFIVLLIISAFSTPAISVAVMVAVGAIITGIFCRHKKKFKTSYDALSSFLAQDKDFVSKLPKEPSTVAISYRLACKNSNCHIQHLINNINIQEHFFTKAYTKNNQPIEFNTGLGRKHFVILKPRIASVGSWIGFSGSFLLLILIGISGLVGTVPGLILMIGTGFYFEWMLGYIIIQFIFMLIYKSNISK